MNANSFGLKSDVNQIVKIKTNSVESGKHIGK